VIFEWNYAGDMAGGWLFCQNRDGENISVEIVYLMNVGVEWVMDVYVRGRDGCRIGDEMGVMRGST